MKGSQDAAGPATCDLGLIGLGVMGRNLALNFADQGLKIAVYNRTTDKSRDFAAGEGGVPGIFPAMSLPELRDRLRQPRIILIMVLAGDPVDAVINALVPLLSPGDLIIDGGNSHFTDTDRRNASLAAAGLLFLGLGVSGGELGARYGPSFMPGGCRDGYERVEALLLAAAARVHGEPCVSYLGPGSAGHFVKMVHNGIEYGLMAAYAEGLNILRNANIGKVQHDVDAETAPLQHPEFYQYDVPVADVAEVWRRGSVIASWLLDLTAAALLQDPDLSQFAGRVSDSGEGRWTVAAAIDEGVPATVLAAALFDRFASQGNADYADKVLSAMRYAFGGHLEKTGFEPGSAGVSSAGGAQNSSGGDKRGSA